MMTQDPDNAQHWRDLAENLTPDAIQWFERFEQFARTNAHLTFPDADPASVLRDVQAQLLEEALQQVQFAHIQLPPDATGAETWQDDGDGNWARLLFGFRRDTGHLAVEVNGEQNTDGTVKWWRAYCYTDDDPTSPDDLRTYASNLLQAADELERLTGK